MVVPGGVGGGGLGPIVPGVGGGDGGLGPIVPGVGGGLAPAAPAEEEPPVNTPGKT